ncbi:MAG: hypothetical protein WBD40_22460 [Tepidisphaeraceae bacterium]
MKTGQKLRVGIFELQELEVRRFLTTASIGSSNTLNILGTGSGETIFVNRLSNGRVSVTGVGSTFVPGSGGGQFNKINISGVGGSDSITISGNVPYNSATITGGSGNDTIVGGASGDRIIGDGGFDTANYSARVNALRIDLDGNADDGWASGEGDNVQTEEVLGGSGNDTITGSGGSDFLAGGGGADSLTGNGGNDELVGSTGQDKMFGNDGDDALYAKNNDVDTVNGGGGPDDFDLAEIDGGDVSGLAAAATARSLILQANGIDPAALDTTYGGNGTGLNSGPDLNWSQITAATVDSQGRVILVGYAFRDNLFDGFSFDFVATRYNADGSWDSGFADDGEMVVDFTENPGGGYSDDDFAFGVTTDADDNIFIVGSSSDEEAGGSEDFALCRLDVSGAFDGTFGTHRYDIVSEDTTIGGNGRDVAHDVVVQADGKIVVVGTSNVDVEFGGGDVAIIRLDDLGELDGGFNGTGMNTLDVGSDEGVAVALQNLPGDEGAQRIIVGGVSNGNFLVARFTPVGDLDGSFNDIGYRSFDINDGSTDVLNDVAVNAGNEIVAVGQSYFPITFTSALKPTPIFSAAGVLANVAADGSTSSAQTSDTVASYNAAAFDADGNVVVVGSNGSDFILTRYTATFALDTSFNDGMPIVTDFTPVGDSPWLDAALGLGVVGGKIVVGGYSDTNGDGDYQTSVARFGSAGGEGEVTEVEGFISYDDVQNDDGDNRSTGATLYLKASQLDDESGALVTLGNNKNVVKIYTIENEDGVEQVAVDVNGLVVYYDLTTTRITINANYGNDVITATDDVLIPLFINGNGGNDTIIGGGGNDQITGGSGDDSVRGGAGHDVIQGRQDKDKVFGDAGNDILIGGSQADSLSGGDGEDILIGGTIAYENDTEALESLSAEWRSGNDNPTRILNLRNGGGLNGTNVLTVGSGGTIFNDSARDSLTGGNDRDWFFRKNSGTSSQRDTIIGGSSGEEVDNY